MVKQKVEKKKVLNKETGKEEEVEAEAPTE